jgi:LysR family glycine cleavage system transcriptional activator
MAKSGQGVALVPDFLAARDIAAGTVTAFSRRLVPSGRAYRLCYRKSRAHEPQLGALRDWLLSGMAEKPGRRRRLVEIQNVAKP